MSKKSKYTLVGVDLLTLILVVMQIQSMIATYIEFSDCTVWANEYEIYVESIACYSSGGWASVLNAHFRTFVNWTKFVLFFANIYAIKKKLILIFKKVIDSRVAFSIPLNLLFIGLKL